MPIYLTCCSADGDAHGCEMEDDDALRLTRGIRTTCHEVFTRTKKLKSYYPLFLYIFIFSIELMDSVMQAQHEKLEFASLNGHLYIFCHIDGSNL